MKDLTFVIPAFNAEGSMESSIKSAQGCSPHQIIVVDDGSSDKTGQKAEKLACTTIRQPNRGASAARRTGLQHVDTDFVIFLDSDDAVLPAGLEKLIHHFRQQPEDVVMCGGRVAQRRNDESHGRTLKRKHETVDSISLLNHGFSPWPPCAAIWRTSAARRIHHIQPEPLYPRYAEDFEWLIRAALIGKILTVDHLVATYQVSGGKSERNIRAAIQSAQSIREYYSKHLKVSVPHLSQWQISNIILRRRVRSMIADGTSWATRSSVQAGNDS